MTEKEWQKKRRAIIESREGCDCPNVIGTKLVPASERCNKTWIRCNGVLRIQYAALEKLGPKPTTQPSGHSHHQETKGKAE